MNNVRVKKGERKIVQLADLHATAKTINGPRGDFTIYQFPLVGGGVLDATEYLKNLIQEQVTQPGAYVTINHVTRNNRSAYELTVLPNMDDVSSSEDHDDPGDELFQTGLESKHQANRQELTDFTNGERVARLGSDMALCMDTAQGIIESVSAGTELTYTMEDIRNLAVSMFIQLHR